MEEFYYRFANVETTTPWARPTWERFYAWWDKFKTFEGVEDYEFHIVGGSLYDIENTWDVDVTITNPIKNFVVLGELIRRGRDMALNEFNIYVDLFWYDSIQFCYDDITEENKRYYLKGTLKGDEVKIRNGEEVLYAFEKNGLVPNKDDQKDMVFFFIQQPTPKHLKKPKDYHRTPPIKLK
jgi:hypothetical protein